MGRSVSGLKGVEVSSVERGRITLEREINTPIWVIRVISVHSQVQRPNKTYPYHCYFKNKNKFKIYLSQKCPPLLASSFKSILWLHVILFGACCQFFFHNRLNWPWHNIASLIVYSLVTFNLFRLLILRWEFKTNIFWFKIFFIYKMPLPVWSILWLLVYQFLFFTY